MAVFTLKVLPVCGRPARTYISGDLFSIAQLVAEDLMCAVGAILFSDPDTGEVSDDALLARDELADFIEDRVRANGSGRLTRGDLLGGQTLAAGTLGSEKLRGLVIVVLVTRGSEDQAVGPSAYDGNPNQEV